MANTSKAIVQPMSYTVPPQQNAAALDTAIRAKVDALAKNRIDAGGTVFFNTVKITGFTVIVDSKDAVTYTSMITWSEQIDPTGN